MMRLTLRALLLLGSLAIVLAACVQGGGPNPNPTPTASLSIGAPQEGQSLAGAVIVMAGGVGGSAQDLSFTLGDLTVDAESDGTAVLNTRSLADGSYTLTANASVDGQQVTDTVDVDVINDLPDSGQVGPNGGTLKSNEGSYATLPQGALDQNANLTLIDTTQQQILDDFGVDYTDLGVTFLGALTVDASGTSSERSNTPVQVDLAGWAQAVQPQQDVVMFNVLPDANGDGVGELTFAAQARATPDGSVITLPAPDAEVYGFAAGNGSLRLQQATTVRPGEIVTLQGRGLTPHSPLGNTARFPGGNEILVVPTDLEQSVANPLQAIVMAVPDLGQGNTQLTLRNGSTGFESEPLTLQVGSTGSGNQTTWNAFVEQLDAALQGVTEGQPELLALGGSFLSALPDDPTLRAMAINGGLISAQNLALLEGIGAGSYGANRRDLVARHALLLDAMAVSVGSGPAAELASLLMVATPSEPNPSATSLRGQQSGGGSCSGPSAPVFWGQPTGMGSAPPGSCSAGGTGGAGGGGSPLRTQRLGGFGPVEGAIIRVQTPDGESLLSPFTAVTDSAGQFFIPFIPPGEPFRLNAIDTVTGDRAEAVSVAGAVGELSAINLAFAPTVAEPGDPVASFTFTQTAPGMFAFDATPSFDSDGEIVEYIWNFGDGSPPDFYWETAEWLYRVAGTFTVTLTVIDDDGNSGATQRTLPTLDPVFSVELIADHALDAAIDQSGDLVGFHAFSDATFNETEGIVVLDTTTDVSTRADTAADGTPGDDWSDAPDLGGSGRYVLFESQATNLAPSPAEFYLKDLQTSDVLPIDAALVGETDGCIERGSLSSDGRHLGLLWDSRCFQSSFSTSLAYLVDLDTMTVTHLNTLADGSPASPLKARTVVVDADGSVALFSHDDANLVPGDDNGWTDTFRKDLATGAVERLTLRSNGEQLDDFTGWPLDGSLSDDGERFLFTTRDGSVVADDTNDAWDVFLHDLGTGVITRVSTRADGSQLASGSENEAILSGDGRYALFNINRVTQIDDPLATDGSDGLVVKDLDSGEIAWVNRTDLGVAPINTRNNSYGISANGRWIVFEEFRLVAEADPDSIGVYRVENPLWEAAP